MAAKVVEQDGVARLISHALPPGIVLGRLGGTRLCKVLVAGFVVPVHTHFGQRPPLLPRLPIKNEYKPEQAAEFSAVRRQRPPLVQHREKHRVNPGVKGVDNTHGARKVLS
eukprot:CAMPEP_0119146438 /NCGR_PEP_ID=MMETSP1310-20130426/38903_1 /TAXON_ID=464262 /ORGANISM="Genus nov. species nov., Strain RCC2339" /LENGTH=110 /DNA_ID=CAMNT_0007138331 /DNA_START=97 /DNA_END=429 /DNA_ORIENTATION=-